MDGLLQGTRLDWKDTGPDTVSIMTILPALQPLSPGRLGYLRFRWLPDLRLEQHQRKAHQQRVLGTSGRPYSKHLRQDGCVSLAAVTKCSQKNRTHPILMSVVKHISSAVSVCAFFCLA